MANDNSGSKLVKIHSDKPAIENKHFGFDAYADTLAGVIAKKNNETPLVIGIYGPWGAGKTTLMEAIKERLDGQTKDPLAEHFEAEAKDVRPCKTVWFQAWKYDQESEILAGLLESVFKTMCQDGFFNQIKAGAVKLAKGLDKNKLVGFASELMTGVDISKFFREPEYKKSQGYYDTFRDFFTALIKTYLNWHFKPAEDGTPKDSLGAMVIFIDDLDRCPQPRIVKVLDTVKLFMDFEGCVFVIGAAHDIIVKALKKEYGEAEDARRFMEKIVQVSFSLPKVTETMFQAYLKDDLGQDEEEMAKYLSLISPAMAYNPRQMKRFFSRLNLRHGMMRSSGVSISFEPVLLWGIIEHAFEDAAKYFALTPGNLYTLKEKLPAITGELGHERIWEADEQLLGGLTVPESLHKYIKDQRLMPVLAILDVDKEAFEEMVTFAASTKADEAEDTGEPAPKRPDMGRWTETMVAVPAGPFKFGDKPNDARIEAPYWIDIYLVTNARFREFVKDGGYETDKWWEHGWKWREENRIMRPDFWDDAKFNRGEQPVVGVSWFEAKAFCKWLSNRSTDGSVYDLLSEKQWERAARGTEGLVYPWGNEFDKERCNTRESEIGRTTRVDRYANGVSPVGCYDMAGNVWEWATDFYDDDKDAYVIKGGSWNSTADDARCTDRNGYRPKGRNGTTGFRCVRTKN